MGCERTDFPGGYVISCSRGSRTKPCGCGRPSTLLCDFALRGAKAGSTCSAPVCAGCSTRFGDLDMCPAHARVMQARDERENGGV